MYLPGRDERCPRETDGLNVAITVEKGQCVFGLAQLFANQLRWVDGIHPTQTRDELIGVGRFAVDTKALGNGGL